MSYTCAWRVMPAVYHPVIHLALAMLATPAVFIRWHRVVFAWSANFETLTPKLFSFFAFVNPHSRERVRTPPTASLRSTRGLSWFIVFTDDSRSIFPASRVYAPPWRADVSARRQKKDRQKFARGERTRDASKRGSRWIARIMRKTARVSADRKIYDRFYSYKGEKLMYNRKRERGDVKSNKEYTYKIKMLLLSFLSQNIFFRMLRANCCLRRTVFINIRDSGNQCAMKRGQQTRNTSRIFDFTRVVQGICWKICRKCQDLLE